MMIWSINFFVNLFYLLYWNFYYHNPTEKQKKLDISALLIKVCFSEQKIFIIYIINSIVFICNDDFLIQFYWKYDHKNESYNSNSSGFIWYNFYVLHLNFFGNFLNKIVNKLFIIIFFFQKEIKVRSIISALILKMKFKL